MLGLCVRGEEGEGFAHLSRWRKDILLFSVGAQGQGFWLLEEDGRYYCIRFPGGGNDGKA